MRANHSHIPPTHKTKQDELSKAEALARAHLHTPPSDTPHTHAHQVVRTVFTAHDAVRGGQTGVHTLSLCVFLRRLLQRRRRTLTTGSGEWVSVSLAFCSRFCFVKKKITCSACKKKNLAKCSLPVMASVPRRFLSMPTPRVGIGREKWGCGETTGFA